MITHDFQRKRKQEEEPSHSAKCLAFNPDKVDYQLQIDALLGKDIVSLWNQSTPEGKYNALEVALMRKREDIAAWMLNTQQICLSGEQLEKMQIIAQRQGLHAIVARLQISTSAHLTHSP